MKTMNMSTFEMSQKTITGKKVLLWMIAFFGVIFAVNFTFLFVAFDTFPGLSSEQAYEEGQAINTTIAEADAQAKVGWTSEPVLSGTDIQVRMTAKDGKLLTDLGLTVIFHRPLGEPFDIESKLEETSPGLYMTSHSLPLPGRWKIKISAIDPQGQTYKMMHELQLASPLQQ